MYSDTECTTPEGDLMTWAVDDCDDNEIRFCVDIDGVGWHHKYEYAEDTDCAGEPIGFTKVKFGAEGWCIENDDGGSYNFYADCGSGTDSETDSGTDSSSTSSAFNLILGFFLCLVVMLK